MPSYEYVDRGYGILEKREKEGGSANGRVRLPSGASFLLDPPDATFLFGLARRVKEDPGEIGHAAEELICKCCVSPRVAVNPTRPGERRYSDIDIGDQIFIVLWAICQVAG